MANLANCNEFAKVLLCQIILQNFYKKDDYQCENTVYARVSLAIVFGTMLLLKYFRPTKEKLELPDPNGSLNGSMPSSAVSSANAKAKDVLEKQMSTGSRGPYLTLTPAQKYHIGKRAAECGTTAAIRYYQKKFPLIFTVERDRKGHGRYQFLFRKEAQFHPSLRSIFLYICDILVP